MKGSSPLTRGKLIAVDLNTMRERLIPAHAGKTRLAVRLASELGAHPRSRGENWSMILSNESMRGSSPLTRGKLRDHG